MPFVILMRRQHLDNTIFFVFHKLVILKRENKLYASEAPPTQGCTFHKKSTAMRVHNILSNTPYIKDFFLL
jgi:hypothetical protein